MVTKYKKIAEVAALAGKILLESHAESYRVEETVYHILKTSGFSMTEVVSTSTGLTMTLDDDDEAIDPITLVRRVNERTTHLSKIYRVNNISRALVKEEMDIETAYKKLLKIDASEYNVFSKDLATILLVLGFAILFGANGIELILAFLTGCLVAFSRILKEWLALNGFIYGIISTLISSFCLSLIVTLIPGKINQDIIIVSALMPLFPGTAFTNGIRDVLKGDYVSGVARIADAFVIAVSLALGVALGLFLSQGVQSWFN
ncbi:threonine/serine ThrE exporter family protein [Eremococcus coleocola]|uniref:Threonine/serine exporter-like N-terminal domain-containing protein n=1 Tax=Eremococcus coleocola ACS-139-V-Col8 TaxID=908337 RepID=E4KPF5_9LACT|nr:threonine/serine exporter family protein [Eremococcus coleocola]EFR31242.1 hypothetical protein HMPREF9257_1443 [Eremococcus coleocola ACS-139-V-Col8]